MLWGFGLVVMAMSVLFAKHRTLRLLRRIRVLLVVLVLLFVFFTPGEALLSFLGRAGPTIEGLDMALVHGGRLLVVVMLVSILLEKTDERTLVSGLMALARPLGCVGLSIERLAVRVLLAFGYVESPPPGGWRALMTESSDRAELDSLTVVFTPLRWLDRFAIAGLVVLMAWLVSK